MAYVQHFKMTFKHMYGALLISMLLTAALWGISLSMVTSYFLRHARNDSIIAKSTIAILITLGTLETIFNSHQVYDFFITKQDSAMRTGTRDIIPASVPGKTACILLVTFVSHLFYASRIWFFGSSLKTIVRFSAIPICALTVLQLAGGLMQVVVMSEAKLYTAMSGRTYTLLKSMYIHGAAASACDILITACLVYIFRSTGVYGTRRTQNLIEKLVRYAINRGIVTTVLALLSIFLFDFASGTFYYLIPFSCSTHVYVISVTSMLMAREGLRQDLDRSLHVSDLMISFTKSQAADPMSTTGSGKETHVISVSDKNEAPSSSQQGGALEEV